MNIGRNPVLLFFLAISLPPIPHLRPNMRLSSAYWKPEACPNTSPLAHLFNRATGRAGAAQILLFFFLFFLSFCFLEGNEDERVVKDGVYSIEINFDKSNVALHLRESGGWKNKKRTLHPPPSPPPPPHLLPLSH